jgi:Putative prokaryotic signal transducing protein
MPPEPLACPRCATKHSLDERFCRECGMPLVYVGRREQEPITDAQGRARKIKPQFSRGELIRVAGGRNQAEAELIQGILLEEGIPSIQKRTRGFDVPDFLAAGPRDILVPESAYEAARELLTGSELASGNGAPPAGADTSPARLAAYLLVALALAALIVWALYQAIA